MEHASNSVKLFRTGDDSCSLFSEVFGESYHSHHGAITESMLVFIQNGLLPLLSLKKHIRIFEMGFGTGLNAVLTQLNQGDSSIYYEAVEKYPPPELLVHKFAEAQWPGENTAKSFYYQLHAAPWNQKINISSSFILKKLFIDLSDFDPLEKSFDLIYFDAFSPETQAELWSEKVFSKLSKALQKDGLLVTYSSRGLVKNALRQSGFKVERLPGPPGKRHVLRAIKL